MNTAILDKTEHSVRIACQGHLDAAACQQHQTQMQQWAFDFVGHRVVLDLSAVDLLDSSGIGAIVYLFKRIRASGGELALLGVCGQPKKLLKMLRVHHAIPVIDSLESGAGQRAIQQALA